MQFLDPALEAYTEKNTTSEPAVLKKLYRETHLNVLLPQMLSGHIQGRTLAMFSHMIQPQNILEIGTYTGYSAICMAEGLQKGGKLHTIDVNEELETMMRRYFEAADMDEKIQLHIGNALDIIPTIAAKFDLVFIDADKENYSNYFDLVMDKMNPGGFIIADNVLWSGKVLDPKPNDAETNALVAYADKIQADDRVENVMLPIRDGLLVARVK